MHSEFFGIHIHSSRKGPDDRRIEQFRNIERISDLSSHSTYASL